MLLARRRLDPVSGGLTVAPSFEDIGPHQFRLARSDDLYVLDPPLSTHFAPIHADIARFLFGLTRLLSRRGGKRRRQRSQRRVDLCEAFLAGYAETGPEDVRTPQGRWLIDVYRGYASAGMAHKRLTNRQYAEALRYGSAWLWTAAGLRLHGSATSPKAT